jgi:hypothetical protein
MDMVMKHMTLTSINTTWRQNSESGCGVRPPSYATDATKYNVGGTSKFGIGNTE